MIEVIAWILLWIAIGACCIIPCWCIAFNRRCRSNRPGYLAFLHKWTLRKTRVGNRFDVPDFEDEYFHPLHTPYDALVIASVVKGTCALLLAFVIMVVIICLIALTFSDSLTFAPVKASECNDECKFSDPTDLLCCNYKPLLDPSNPFNAVRVPFFLNGSLAPSIDAPGAIDGWALSNSTAPTGNPDATFAHILYNHGSGWNVAVKYRWDRYSHFLSAGRVNLFIYDYAGYGASHGIVSESSVKESAAAALQVALNHFQITRTQLTVAGRSLGGGVAVQLAVGNVGGSIEGQTVGASSPPVAVAPPPTPTPTAASAARLRDALAAHVARRALLVGTNAQHKAVAQGTARQGAVVQPRALILQSTFASLAEEAGSYFGIFSFIAQPLWGVSFESASVIGKYARCLYQSHSEDDEWVAFASAQNLYTAASGTTCKEFVEAEPPTKHDDPMTDGEIEALRTFIDTKARVLPRRRR